MGVPMKNPLVPGDGRPGSRQAGSGTYPESKGLLCAKEKPNFWLLTSCSSGDLWLSGSRVKNPSCLRLSMKGGGLFLLLGLLALPPIVLREIGDAFLLVVFCVVAVVMPEDGVGIKSRTPLTDTMD